jgi:glycosyltransferase involved in cell wall biosynthesis
VRVLLVNDYDVTGGYGAEAYVRRLARGLTEAGDDVRVWAGEVSHESAGRWRDLWDPRAGRQLRSVIEQWQPEMVHFHNVVRECSASVLRTGGVPAVMTVHDHRLLGVADQRGHGVRGAVQRRGARASGRLVRNTARRHMRAVMAVSDDLQKALLRQGFRSVTTVPVPVEPPVAEPRPVQACRDIAFVGRLTVDKGADVALAAFARVAADHPDTHLLIAGDGPLHPELARASAVLGDQVRLLGKLAPDEVSALIGSCRIVVAPSVPTLRPEGSPTIVVEAAAHGRPLIASDDPGLRAAASRLGGAVITPALDVAALAAALARLLDDDQHARTLGTAARAAVFARHGLDVVTRTVREVYRDVAPCPTGP